VSGTKLLQTLNSQIYMKNNGQVDWAAVRHAYCAGDQKVAEICQQYGISKAGLYYHRRTNNWPSRNDLSARVAVTSKQIRKNKIQRLYLLLDRLMEEIEMQPVSAADNDGMSKSGTADRERSARTLSSLIRSFEKIRELEAEEVSEIKKTNNDGVNEAEEKEAETLRNILYEKIEKLVQAESS